MLEGQIIEGRGGIYTIRDHQGNVYPLRAKGKFRKQGMSPLVGDYVSFTPGKGEEHGWIEEIHARKTVSLRPAAANVELLLITLAPVPQPDFLLIDRLLVRARQQGMETLLVYNKADLDEGQGVEIEKDYERAYAPFFPVSALEQQGIEPLRAAMEGKLACMAGQSGVGKTTILNAVLGEDLVTGSISKKTERGKHTTRHATLLIKGNIHILDTPGFSLLGLEQMEPVDLQNYYPEFTPYEGHCRFAPCYHESEPGCSVLQAAHQGEIPARRIERYHYLLNEVKETWRGRYD